MYTQTEHEYFAQMHINISNIKPQNEGALLWFEMRKPNNVNSSAFANIYLMLLCPPSLFYMCVIVQPPTLYMSYIFSQQTAALSSFLYQYKKHTERNVCMHVRSDIKPCKQTLENSQFSLKFYTNIKIGVLRGDFLHICSLEIVKPRISNFYPLRLSF